LLRRKSGGLANIGRSKKQGQPSFTESATTALPTDPNNKHNNQPTPMIVKRREAQKKHKKAMRNDEMPRNDARSQQQHHDAHGIPFSESKFFTNNNNQPKTTHYIALIGI